MCYNCLEGWRTACFLQGGWGGWWCGHSFANSKHPSGASQLKSPLALVVLLFDIQGTLTPLLGIGVCVSIQFGALEYAKRVFAQRNIDQRLSSAGPDGKILTPTQLVASGAFAGIANGFVSGPVEHIRIRK